jgi:hypothetical protein
MPAVISTLMPANGVRRVTGALVKGLPHGQFEHLPGEHLAVGNIVDPEFAAFSGVAGDRLTVLAGNSDFHGYPRQVIKLAAWRGGSQA